MLLKNISRKQFILIFILLTLAIVFCYLYVDRALVDFLYENQARQYNWLALCAEIPPIIAGIVVLVIYALALFYFLISQTNRINKWIHIANICSISVFFKDIAKMSFNRYFPETWFFDNLSYLKNGAYGFGGVFTKLMNSSFPSGHVTIVSSFVMSVIYFYPKLFYALIPMVLLTIAGQVIFYYHFLSDVIAALLLAFIIGSIYCEYLHTNGILPSPRGDDCSQRCC